MSDTQVLLSKISALRQRLEQAQSLATEAAAGLARKGAAEPVRALERRVAAGSDDGLLLDGALRELGDSAAPPPAAPPVRLTARARRVLERGRELLDRLRALADVCTGDAPLAPFYRDTAAMTDATLRLAQTLPDAASAQLRLCEGMEAVLAVVADRLATLAAAAGRHRLWAERTEALAGLLASLFTGRTLDVKPFVALAEAVLDEAHQSAPLRFLAGDLDGGDVARAVACHSLTAAQVVARVVRHDPELRGRPLEPVLAALVHDVGMLGVPGEVLAQSGPLDDAQRRSLEGHVRVGASLAARLLPSGSWLVEAAAGHHERLDGTGYPDGLRELQIAPLTRLLAVCDVYAAMCCPRPHRPAKDTRTALTDTLLLAEQGALDGQHAERLLHLSFYPVGSVVELADGAVGVVVATPWGRRDLSAPARPVLALLTDARGQPLPAPLHLDLAQADSRSIVRTLPPAERRALLGRRYPEWA